MLFRVENSNKYQYKILETQKYKLFVNINNIQIHKKYISKRKTRESHLHFN